MSNKRAVFFQILTPVLLLITIYMSWDVQGLMHKAADRLGETGRASTSDLEERLFENQSKVIIGMMKLVGERYQASDPSSAAVEKTNADLKRIFESIVLKNHPVLDPDAPAAEQRSRAPSLLIKQAIVSYAVGYDDEALKLLNAARAGEGAGRMGEIAELLTPAVTHAARGKAVSTELGQTTLSAEQASMLENELGWYGSLFLVSSGRQNPPEGKQLSRAVYEEAKMSAIKFLIFGITILLLLVLSILLSGVFLMLALSRRLHWRFTRAAFPVDFGLEIFAIYLIGMLCGPQLIKLLHERGLELDPIRGSMAMILCMLVVLAWPLAGGTKLQDLRSALGLSTGGPVKFLQDLITGPAAYIGSIFFFLILLAVYSTILMKLNVNISSGTHPVVPILLSEEDRSRTWAIIILAVVIAPIVEEVMFRGALYSWLRARTGAFLAVCASAFVFAVIHPQGPVGLVPLAAIGATLALLREWRGSLVAPMLAHACFNGGTLLLLYLFLM